MIIRNSSGRQRFSLLVSVVVCALSTHTAYGWQQEYIVDAMSGHTAERYTWDSDHQPRYNDILEERIRSTKSVAGPVVNGGPNDAGYDQRYEYGLEFPRVQTSDDRPDCSPTL